MKLYFPNKTKSTYSEETLCEVADRGIAELSKDTSNVRDGRGQIYLDQRFNPALIMKRYRRGGLWAKLVKSHYFGINDQRTRMVREMALLDAMSELDLPVPNAVAAVVVRRGPLYGGYLLLEQIPNTQTIAAALCDQPLNEGSWYKVGQTIKAFHKHGVFHADLNASNILIDPEGKIYLIDFDKSEFKKGEGWKQVNLARLKRSLKKFSANERSFYFSEADWSQLERGYQSS